MAPYNDPAKPKIEYSFKGYLQSTTLDEGQFLLGKELVKASLCDSKSKMRECIREMDLKEDPERLKIVGIVLSISIELNHMNAAKVLAKYLDRELWRINLLLDCISHKKWLQARHLLSDNLMKDKIKIDLTEDGFFDMLKTATMTQPSYEWDQERTIEALISLGDEFNYSAYVYPHSYELDDPEEEVEEEEDPLVFTIKAGSLDMVECLLIAGVKPNNDHFNAVDKLKTRAETIESLMERYRPKKRKREAVGEREMIKKIIRYQKSNQGSHYN